MYVMASFQYEGTRGNQGKTGKSYQFNWRPMAFCKERLLNKRERDSEEPINLEFAYLHQIFNRCH